MRSYICALALSLVASVTAATTPSYKGPLITTPVATNWISFNLDAFYQTNSSQGSTYNIGILQGNWTDSTTGKLIATVIPGAFNGEIDFVDNNGVLHVDQKYAIEFANDKSLGLVQFTAMGTILVGCTGMITVQTESTANAHWNNQLWITPGYFINSNTIKQTMYQQSWAP